MAKIFISYRREDSQHQADRLHAALSRKIPKRNIFIDVDNIPVGVNFVQHLDQQVAQCDVLLALIGPDWLEARNPETGARRLDDPRDFVRIEIAAALKRGIPVAPILLDGAPFPPEHKLPDDLKALTLRNGVEVRRLTFDADTERLVRGLDLTRAAAAAARPAPARKPPATGTGTGNAAWIGPAVAFGLLVLGGGAWAWIGNPGDWRDLGQTGQVLASEPASNFPVEVIPRDPASAAAPGPAPAVSAPSASSRSAGETFRDCSDCPQMVSVPSGSFMMGSPASEAGRRDNEGPQRRVTVPAFAAGKFEVTWNEYHACVSAGGCAYLTADGHGGRSGPVTNVSWNEAVAYTKWLSNKTGQIYRLLSEAEWEYAARAGTLSAYWWGGRASHEYANYGKDMCCDGLASGADRWVNTSPAGSFPANGFGLHDMHGNVLEWVQDCYAETYSAGQPSNGSAYQGGSCFIRVFRGGSWYLTPPFLRSATRNWDAPTNRSYSLGFRVARTL